MMSAVHISYGALVSIAVKGVQEGEGEEGSCRHPSLGVLLGSFVPQLGTIVKSSREVSSQTHTGSKEAQDDIARVIEEMKEDTTKKGQQEESVLGVYVAGRGDETSLFESAKDAVPACLPGALLLNFHVPPRKGEGEKDSKTSSDLESVMLALTMAASSTDSRGDREEKDEGGTRALPFVAVHRKQEDEDEKGKGDEWKPVTYALFARGLPRRGREEKNPPLSAGASTLSDDGGGGSLPLPLDGTSRLPLGDGEGEAEGGTGIQTPGETGAATSAAETLADDASAFLTTPLGLSSGGRRIGEEEEEEEEEDGEEEEEHQKGQHEEERGEQEKNEEKRGTEEEREKGGRYDEPKKVAAETEEEQKDSTSASNPSSRPTPTTTATGDHTPPPNQPPPLQPLRHVRTHRLTPAQAAQALQSILEAVPGPMRVCDLEDSFEAQCGQKVSEALGFPLLIFLREHSETFPMEASEEGEGEEGGEANATTDSNEGAESRSNLVFLNRRGKEGAREINKEAKVNRKVPMDEKFVVSELERLIDESASTGSGAVCYISSLCGRFIQKWGVSVTSVIGSRPLDVFKKNQDKFLLLGGGNVTLRKCGSREEVMKALTQAHTAAMSGDGGGSGSTKYRTLGVSEYITTGGAGSGAALRSLATTTGASLPSPSANQKEPKVAALESSPTQAGVKTQTTGGETNAKGEESAAPSPSSSGVKPAGGHADGGEAVGEASSDTAGKQPAEQGKSAQGGEKKETKTNSGSASSLTEQTVLEEFRRLILADGAHSVYISSLCGRFLQKYGEPVSAVIGARPAEFLRKYPDVFVMTGGGNVGLKEILGDKAESVPPPAPREPKRAVMEFKKQLAAFVSSIELSDEILNQIQQRIATRELFALIFDQVQKLADTLQRHSFLLVKDVVRGGSVGKGLVTIENRDAAFVLVVRQLPKVDHSKWLESTLESLQSILEMSIGRERGKNFRVDSESASIKFTLMISKRQAEQYFSPPSPAPGTACSQQASRDNSNNNSVSSQYGGERGSNVPPVTDQTLAQSLAEILVQEGVDICIQLSPEYGDRDELMSCIQQAVPSQRHFFRPSLLSDEVYLVSNQPAHVRTCLRLVKFWAAKQSWASPHTTPDPYLLELVVIHSVLKARATAETGTARLLELVFADLRDFESLRILWADTDLALYRLPDIWRPLLCQSPIVMDPVNPFRNLADPQVFDGRQLVAFAQQQGALECFRKEAAKLPSVQASLHSATGGSLMASFRAKAERRDDPLRGSTEEKELHLGGGDRERERERTDCPSDATPPRSRSQPADYPTPLHSEQRERGNTAESREGRGGRFPNPKETHAAAAAAMAADGFILDKQAAADRSQQAVTRHSPPPSSPPSSPSEDNQHSQRGAVVVSPTPEEREMPHSNPTTTDPISTKPTPPGAAPLSELQQNYQEAAFNGEPQAQGQTETQEPTETAAAKKNKRRKAKKKEIREEAQQNLQVVASVHPQPQQFPQQQGANTQASRLPSPSNALGTNLNPQAQEFCPGLWGGSAAAAAAGVHGVGGSVQQKEPISLSQVLNLSPAVGVSPPRGTPTGTSVPPGFSPVNAQRPNPPPPPPMASRPLIPQPPPPLPEASAEKPPGKKKKANAQSLAAAGAPGAASAVAGAAKGAKQTKTAAASKNKQQLQMPTQHPMPVVVPPPPPAPPGFESVAPGPSDPFAASDSSFGAFGLGGQHNYPLSSTHPTHTSPEPLWGVSRSSAGIGSGGVGGLAKGKPTETRPAGIGRGFGTSRGVFGQHGLAGGSSANGAGGEMPSFRQPPGVSLTKGGGPPGLHGMGVGGDSEYSGDSFGLLDGRERLDPSDTQLKDEDDEGVFGGGWGGGAPFWQ